MKKWLLGLILVCNCFCYSQELINYYVEPHTPTSLVIHTTVFKETIAEFASFEADVEDDTILVKLCYLFGSSQTITIDQQEHIINLPNSQDSYTVTYELYGDGDNEFPCDMSNLVDTGVVTINFPHNPAQTIVVPDDVFEEYLEDFGYGDGIANNDLVRTNKIINLTHLLLSESFVSLTGDIYSLEGLHEFQNLRELYCDNHELSEIDVSTNLLLEKLSCSYNPITELQLENNTFLKFIHGQHLELSTLNLNNNPALEELYISNNSILNLDLSQNINLKIIDIRYNELSTLQVQENQLLEVLWVSNNFLSELDLSSNSFLRSLYCDENQIENLNINGLSNLQYLNLTNNHISELDLSLNSQLIRVLAINNNLSLLNLKNGNNENIEDLVTVNNEELFCIEVDNPDEAPYSGWIVDDHTGFSEDCSLGVVDIISPEINIFPNPVSNILSLSSSSKLQIQQLIVYNIEGGVVFQENNPTNTIDVTKYSNGLYFIELKTNHGILLKRFIKQ